MVNRALSWSCKLCSPISSRLSSGYLLAFWCESVDECAQLHPSFQCAITVQVVGREPIHSGTNLFHCYQHISPTALMCLRRMLGGHTDIKRIQNKTVSDNSVQICKQIWR